MMADQAGLAKGHRTPEHTTGVVNTRIHCPVTSRYIVFVFIYVMTDVKNNKKHNKNHGSQRNKHLFLISRKIILENHGSRLL